VRTLVLPVRDVVQATQRTRIITLDLGGESFSFAAGQAAFVGLAEGRVRRPYSIACSPSWTRETKTLEFLVQIDDHAPPDPHLERAVPATRLRVEGPFGSFGLQLPLQEAHLLFIAGGTGIAPLRSMMWEALAQNVGNIGLVYSARGPQDFAFRDELIQLASQGRIDLRLTITRDAGVEWTGGRGRVDAALIQSMLNSEDTRCLVCGPPSLVTEATATLQAAGVSQEKIASETFAG